MPEIGNLLVSLQMETAAFNKGIAEANAKLDGFGKQFAGVARTIDTHATAMTSSIGRIVGSMKSLAALGVGTGIFAWVKAMADSGEAAENLAASLGLPIAEFRRLEGVLIANGSTAEEAARTLTKLSVALRDGISEPAGEAGRAFQALGITQQQLTANSNNLSGVLDLVADAFKNLPEGPEKTAAMAELLGTRWRSLIGLLKDGSDELARQKQEFDALNPGMAAFEEAARSADKALDHLYATVLATGREAFAVLIGFINEGIARLQTTAEEIRGIIRLFNFFKNLTQGSDQATAEILPPVTVTAPGGSPKIRKGKGGGGGGGGKGSDAEARRLEREAEKERKRIQREAIEAAEEENKISDELFRRKEQRIKSAVALDKLTAQEGITAERKLLDEKMVATQGFYQRKLDAAKADADETRKLHNQETLDYEKFLTEREALNQESAKKLHDEMKGAFSDLGSALKSSFEGIFDSLLEGTFKLRDAVGKLLKDIGKKLISKGFDKLFDIGSSAFGKLFTAGLPGAQYGASFKVGGAGALDSQLVAFRASPGEMVNVNRPGDYGSRGGGQTIRIDLNPSEGWVAGVADQRIVTRSGQIINLAVRQSTKTVSRNFAGMTAETQARQM